jgi:NTE family protein
LWSASGHLPRDLTEAEVRLKDIRISSRTREATDQVVNAQRMRWAFRHVYDQLPEALRATPEVQLLAQEADACVYNIVRLIYHARNHEGVAKDFEFSRRRMEEHWLAGFEAARHALAHPEVLQRPKNPEGFEVVGFSRELKGR